jgi:hypothetical protein
MAQQSSTNFCSSRTTAAYHAPECGAIWIVHDPNRVSDVHLGHSPDYHTYSRWEVNGTKYVLAYWDEDNDPNDIVVDVYRASGAKFEQIGSVTIGAPLTGVKTAQLAPKWGDQLLFLSHCGQMECINVVRVSDGVAKELFEYGADKLVVRGGTPPSIMAKPKYANFLEQFTWSDAKQKFVKEIIRKPSVPDATDAY